MITTYNFPQRAYLEKDCITDQTMTYLQEKLNTSGLGFDVTHGYGVSATDSSVALISFGGFHNQKIEAIMKCTSPTSTPSLGVMARCTSYDSPNQDFYYARIDNGSAKLTRVLAGSYTNLTTDTFSLAVGDECTFTLECVGNALTATFNDGITNVVLEAEDIQIGPGGILGIRCSTNSNFYCSSFKCWQL